MEWLRNDATPDFDSFKQCVLRHREPGRVHYAELLVDESVLASIARRFDLPWEEASPGSMEQARRNMEIYGFLGYDVFPVALQGFQFPVVWNSAEETPSAKPENRKTWAWIEEHRGPIRSWDDFHRYPWPRLEDVDTSPLEWLDRHLDEGMKAYCWNDQVFERLFGLLGYENLCLMLYDDPELVDAVAVRAGELCVGFTRLLCQFDCIGVTWDSDDLGFKSQTLLPPDVLRTLVLPWHAQSARIAHEHRKLYFLHSCGKVDSIMDNLIEEVGLDAKHSFEDAIMPVTEAVKKYGDRIGILGGIDVDFLCRSSEAEIRKRVRTTLDACHAGGGYVLGSGNSIADYVPLDHYLAMLDEGRKYSCGR